MAWAYHRCNVFELREGAPRAARCFLPSYGAVINLRFHNRCDDRPIDSELSHDPSLGGLDPGNEHVDAQPRAYSSDTAGYECAALTPARN